MRGITRDTVVELVDRKFLWVFGAVTVLSSLILYVMAKSDVSITLHSAGQLGGEEQLGGMIEGLMVKSFGSYMSFLVFLAVMASAGLIPRLLEKGTADFYLAKPVGRSSLLLGKLFGIWLVYGMTLAASGLLAYVVAMLSSSVFDFGVLYLVGFSLLLFLIWLSITGLAGVWSGSTVAAVMAAFLVWVFQMILDYHETINQFVDSSWASYLIDGLYYIVPKTSAIGDMAILLARDQPVDSWMPLWSSLIFALAMYYFAARVFDRKDY